MVFSSCELDCCSKIQRLSLKYYSVNSNLREGNMLQD